MEIYLINNQHGDVLVKIVQIENDWAASFMFFNTTDNRFRDCLINAIEACGGDVQEVKNVSVTNGINHCLIRFYKEGKYFCLEAPGRICEAASTFFGAKLELKAI